MEFYYDSIKIEYKVVYSKRKTIAIHIDRDKNIIVRAPRGIDKTKLKGLVESKGNWIVNKLAEVRNYEIQAKKYQKGELFLYLGKEYPLDIVVDDKQKSSQVEIKDNSLMVMTNSADEESIKDLVEHFYRQETLRIVKDRVKYYQKYFVIEPNNIRVKKQKTRWGSCSSLNNLNFNLKLSMAKISVIDYIVVHEMSHLIHLNHSKDFWNQVRSILPDYGEEKAWLRLNGAKLNLD